MQIVPKHIAIVMDGNGRWARERNKPRIAGHDAGSKNLTKIVEACAKKKIQVVTLFAFSTENWNRPKDEVSFLMELFVKVLKRQSKDLHKNNVQLRVIGDCTRFNKRLQKAIIDGQELTANNTGIKLVIAANYSGCWDIAQAARKLGKQIELGIIKADDITPDLFQSAVNLSDLPPPDLLIRTSGEQRISNFMLWQIAYTELYFTDVYWPDFNEAELEKALSFYASRNRRFGLTSEQMECLNTA